MMRVSWDDVTQEYLPWLNRKLGLTGQNAYRLLTEAEWEYAARAGTTTAYTFGDSITGQQAQFSAGQSVEVGTFTANAFGLHDMHGNVWEWVEDCYAFSYANAPISGAEGPDAARCDRVLRGGAWGNDPWNLRSANRRRLNSEERGSGIGFRVTRSLVRPR